MPVSPEYRKKLRERLLGQGSKLVPKEAESAPLVENSDPMNLWGGQSEVKCNMSDNLVESPFDWGWNSKAGNKSISLIEDEQPKELIKEEKAKPEKKVDSFSKSKFKVI